MPPNDRALDTPSAALSQAAAPIRRPLAGLSYSSDNGKRDLRIDMLRGAAMFAMIVDHIGGEHSWLYAITGGNHFFVSAAESFIFLSGLVTGIVYTGSARRTGLGISMIKMLRRAATLYVLAIVVGIGLPVVAHMLRLPWPQPLDQGSLQEFIVSTLTLHRTYYLADILLLYTLLFPCATLAVALIVERRSFLVLGGSWMLWLIWQRWPFFADIPWAIDGNYVFHLSSWQVLFFTALVMGAHLHEVGKYLGRVSTWVYLVVGGAGLGGSLAFYLVGLKSLPGWYARIDVRYVQQEIFAKADVRIGRVIVFVFLAAFAFSLLTLAWKPILAALGWLLLPLGQNSLTAYTLHLFVAALATRLSPLLFGAGQHSAGQNALLQLTGVTLVWLTIKLTPMLGQVAHTLDEAERRLLDEAPMIYAGPSQMLRVPVLSARADPPVVAGPPR